jgi:excisionase family DNA binding protein
MQARIIPIPDPQSEPSVVKWLTLKDVAEALQLHERTVYRHLRSGVIPGQKIGGSWRVHPDALKECGVRLIKRPLEERPNVIVFTPQRGRKSGPRPQRAISRPLIDDREAA